jgi:hypothetical protein
MNAHPDGFLGKASLRIANAKALTCQSCYRRVNESSHPMIGNT